jgi:hypothetical protein
VENFIIILFYGEKYSFLVDYLDKKYLYEQLQGHREFNREGKEAGEGKQKLGEETKYFIPFASYLTSRLVFFTRTFSIIKVLEVSLILLRKVSI